MDQGRHRRPAVGTEVPQGDRGVEAHDAYLAVEGVDERGGFRRRPRAGPQQRMHGLGAAAFVSVAEGFFLQCGPQGGEHPPNLPGEVAQCRDCPEADVPVGVL